MLDLLHYLTVKAESFDFNSFWLSYTHFLYLIREENPNIIKHKYLQFAQRLNFAATL